MRFLAVVDGTERTNRVVEHVVALAQGSSAAEVVILNVQQKDGNARLRGYQTFKQHEVDERLVDDIGAPIVGSVSRKLDKIGIRNHTRVKIGDPAPTILRCASDERCDVIVVGFRGSAGIQRWLAETMGLSISSSVAMRLVALARIPVVAVK